MESLPCARELAVYSDEEFYAFVKAHARIIEVQDPENLRGDLAQRLRYETDIVRLPITELTAAARDRAKSFYNPPKTHIIDLDRVNARLHAKSEPSEQPPPVSSCPSTPPLPTEEEQALEILHAEMIAYPALLAAGGRPPYPQHLLHDFVYQPERYLGRPEYHNIIMFWRSHALHSAERTAFCAGMLSRWEVFRRIQLTKRRDPRDGTWRFNAYTERVQRWLHHYGIRRAIDLKRDPSQQTAMTTWLEYLAFEYKHFDNKARLARKLRPQYDDAWKMLGSSGTLAPGDTDECIHSQASISNRVADSRRVQESLRSAELNFAEAEAAICASAASPPGPENRFTTAKTMLDTAQRDHEQVMQRNGLITKYIQQAKPYRQACKEAEHHDHLLQWIVLQIPLIESETGPSAHDEVVSGRTTSCQVSLVLSSGFTTQRKDHEDKERGDRSAGKAQHRATKEHSNVTIPAKRKLDTHDASSSSPCIKRSKTIDHNTCDLLKADQVMAPRAASTNTLSNATTMGELPTIVSPAPDAWRTLNLYHEATESVSCRRSTRLARQSSKTGKTWQSMRRD